MAQTQQKNIAPFQQTAINTNAQQLRQPTDNLHTFIHNIIVYQRFAAIYPSLDRTQQLKESIKEQLNLLWFQQKIEQLKEQSQYQQSDMQPSQFEKKLYQIEDIIRELQYFKDNNASSEQQYIKYQKEINKYVYLLEKAINSEHMKEQILKGSIFQQEQQEDNKKDELSGTSQIDIPSSHYFLEKINTKIDYSSQVFNYVKPKNHQYYITEAAKTYNDITPYKLKTIALSLTEGPVINRPNFFDQGLDESKTILHYCIPGTNKVAYYSMADVCRQHTINKNYYQQRPLSNQWHFSQYTKSVITPSGKIFAINCRSTKDKIDPYLYEISQTKASNRGPLMTPKRDASLVYMGGFIYLIGGCGQGEKCSRKNYKYSIKEKKWSLIYESNIALRKATLCTVNNRYICKIGGLNQFDYINKTIQLYDSLTDRWSLARCSPRNILEEVSILEDSVALQINDDQIYVFGGKNGNKFSTDTGFVLLISQIREKRKGAAKVSGEFWNVSIGKRNILSFFGTFTSTSPLILHNVIYGLRTQVCKALSI